MGIDLHGANDGRVRNMKKTQKVLLFMEGLWGGVSTMSLGPVIDDAVRTVTKDDFFYSHTQNVSERGSGFSTII